jgi:DNA-binding Xre family transcriptional regulator
MTLDQYLHDRRESAEEFARRAGLRPATVRAIRNGAHRGGCRVDTAAAIVAASEQHPTDEGGTVGWLDLMAQEGPA